MPRFHTVDNERIQFTAEEETARDAEETAVIARRPLRKWLSAMGKSDDKLPRCVEDIYDALSATQQGNVASITRDKVTAKKALRNTKP